MSKEAIELIKNSLNAKGKLNCSDAFKISAKTKTPIEKIGELAKELEIRIDECGLGQFGKLEFTQGSSEVLEKLKPFFDGKKRITCKDARNAASGVGLKAVRSTLKENGIDVTYCELGCFKEKKRSRLYVKTKTWIENEKGELIFGKGKTEVLECIDEEGSIGGAADKIGMNYKKAWTHVQILQKQLDDILVETQKGGGEDRGTRLTPVAKEYMNAYRQLQADIENFANERFKELFLKPRNKKFEK